MFPRDFWLYLASRFCSAAAMMMLRAAIAWHVFALSHSAFHLGLVGLVQFVPVLCLMLVGGALADTYDRRTIMMLAQAVPLACSLALWLATRSAWRACPSSTRRWWRWGWRGPSTARRARRSCRRWW